MVDCIGFEKEKYQTTPHGRVGMEKGVEVGAEE